MLFSGGDNLFSACHPIVTSVVGLYLNEEALPMSINTPNTNNTPSPFTWGAIELNQTVFVDGIPHATRAAVGEWLEYSDDPQKATDKILERNPHIEAHSIPVNLTGMTGQIYATKAYHPIGFLLLVMESGQPKAQAMKAAVAEFVWHFAGPQQLSPKAQLQLRNQRINILAKLDKADKPFVREALLADLRVVSLTLGIEVPDVLLLNSAKTGQTALEGL